MGKVERSERLESRIAFAGDVVSGIDGGQLLLRGDNHSNGLLVERGPLGGTQIRVVPLGTTTVNGQHAPAVFDLPGGGLALETSGGADDVTLAGLRVGGDVRLDAGGGDDRVLLRKMRVAGHTSVGLGDGDDAVTLRHVLLQDDVAVDAGTGDDAVTFSASRVIQAALMNDKVGRADLKIAGSAFGGPAGFFTGDAADRVAVDQSSFRDTARLHTHGGDDHVLIRGTSFRKPADIDDGRGSDVLDREVQLHWDFANGEQGWSGHFSDYTPATVRAGEDGVSDYNLEAGLAPLPADLDSTKSGYRISGDNRSDDLFMFLSRPLTADDGIVGHQHYRVAFDVQFASNVPTGLAGIGGAPAESVFFKVGASTNRPITYSDNGTITVAIRKDATKGQTDISGAGDIRNGEDAGEEGDPKTLVYKIVRRDKVHSYPVGSDTKGRLWLVMGTDSGFEGRTTLYYTSVSVRLTPIID